MVKKVKIVVVIFLFVELPGFGQLIYSYLELGRLELIKGNYTEAIKNLNYSIESRPDRYEAYFFRGLAKYYLDDFEGAEADYNIAIEMFPPNKEVYLFRAVSRDRVFNFEGAFEDYNTALSFDSSYALVYFNRANTYLRLHKYEESLQDVEKAFKYKIQDDNIYLIRGAARSALEKYQEAIYDFNRIISRNPFNFRAYIYRGVSLMRLSRIDSAMNDFNFVLKMDSTNSLALYYRALCKIEKKDKDGALNDLDKVIYLSPYNALAYYNKGIILNDREEGSWEAMFNLDRALALDPDNILIYYNRGLIRYNIKDYDGAMKDMDKLISIFPDFPYAFFLRSSIKQAIGDLIGSKNDHEKAKEINKKNNEKDDDVKLKKGVELLKFTNFAGDFISLSDKKRKVQYQDNEIELKSFFKVIINPDPKKNIYGYEVNDIKNFLIPLISLSNYFSKKDSIIGAELIIDTSIANKASVDLLEVALLKYASDNYFESLSILNEIISFNEEDVISRFSRANLMLELLRLLKNNDSNFQSIALTFFEKYSKEKDAIDISFDNVLEDYDKTIELDEGFYFSYYNRAYAKYLMEDYHGAIDDFWEVIKRNPDLQEAYFNRGLLLILMNEKELGCKDLRKAGELGIIDSYSIMKRYCAN